MQSYFNIIRENLLWTQGRSVIIVSLWLIVCALIVHWAFMGVALVLFLFALYFFRNPLRIIPQEQREAGNVVSPADGTVIDIKASHLPGFDTVISIFLSPLDVHVQWIPVGGVIDRIAYTPGKHHIAFLPKSSLHNEHNDVYIKTACGSRILVRQIAGIIARRIVWWIWQDKTVSAGEKYGMIKFGSRVDLFVPKGMTIGVKIGQRVVGNQTIIGRLKC